MDVLEVVARRIDGDRPEYGRQLVAVDGVGGSGKTRFADALAERIICRSVVVLHVDDFFNPPAVRHARGRHSPEGFWLDTYDYDALTGRALDPLKAGCERYQSSPAAHPAVAANDAVVLVEGTFLHRRELAAYWDTSIYLHVPFEVAVERMIARGTITDAQNDPRMDRYIGAQRIYFEQAAPWARASLVVDNADHTRPRIIDGHQLSDS